MSVCDVLTEVYLTGGPKERGCHHGALHKRRIHAHVSDWLEALRRRGVGDPHRYIATFLSETDFLTETKRVAPELLEEIGGIGEGAGLSSDLVFALQLVDEEWAYRARRFPATKPLTKCSSVAALTGEGAWIGQNMDLGSYTDGHQMILRIAKDGTSPAAFVFSLAGVIALLGINESGVGVCVNSIPQVPSAASGLPVAMVIRRLLMESSAAAAAEVALSLCHATNQHYLIADARELRSLEASSAGVVSVAAPWTDRILHTNHPLASAWGSLLNATTQDENSLARLKSLERHLATGYVTLSALQNALSASDDPANPVCRTYTEASGPINFTTGSIISWVPSIGEIRTWLSDGPPTPERYETYSF